MSHFITTRLGRTLLLTVFAVGATVLTANLACAAYFTGRILPGVQVGGVDIGGLSREAAIAKLNQAIAGYELTVTIGANRYKVNPTNVGVTYDVDATYRQAYAEGRVKVVEAADLLTDKSGTGWVFGVDQNQFGAAMQQLATANSAAAVNPTIVVEGTTPKIVEGQTGYGVTGGELGRLVQTALVYRSDQVSLQRASFAPPLTQSDLAAPLDQAKKLMAVSIEIDDVNNTVFQPPESTIASWLTLDETNNHPTWQVDQTKLGKYVQNMADQVFLPPVNLNITKVNNVEKSRQGGANGSALDQTKIKADITAAILAGQPLKETAPRVVVAYKTLTNNTISLDTPKYIEVNLTTQHLWAYQDHQVVFDAPITSGATGAGFPTVQGLFAIYTKARDTWLNGHPMGYNYDVFVQYWMPFYQGYGLHDASWRNSFGGPDYYYDGSHGCVNMALESAAWLWNWDEVGTPVWVHA